MYIPAAFACNDQQALYALLQQRGLCEVIRVSLDGLPLVSHCPLTVQQQQDGPVLLQGHLARKNPLLADLNTAVPVLVVCNLADAYVSPAWYASKQEHGKVVPTWNYAAIYIRGQLQVMDDAAWLRQQLEQLTRQHEQAIGSDWQVQDAPADYIAQMLQHIVGIQIKVSSIEGKCKASQNQPEANRLGVIQGLHALGHTAMAGMVQRKGF